MTKVTYYRHRWLVVDNVTVPDYADPSRSLWRDPSTVECSKSFATRALARAEAAWRRHAYVIDLGHPDADRASAGRPAYRYEDEDAE